MKLKNIFGVAVFVCATLFMTMAVSAATNLRIGEISNTSTRTVVPVYLESTDIESLFSYDFEIHFDTTKYEFKAVSDPLKYFDEDAEDDVNYGSQNYNIMSEGNLRINWYVTANVMPQEDPNTGLMSIHIADVKFALTDEYDPKDFDFNIITVGEYIDMTSHPDITQFNSFFTFDVTGNLGGTEIDAVGVSTDGGQNITELDKYFSTDLTSDAVAFDTATTKFLVAFNNPASGNEVKEVTVYGKKVDDGTWIPLGEYLADANQSSFINRAFTK